MDIDDFRELAVRVLAEEATPEERARFQALLQEDVHWRMQFQEIRATWWLVREVGPLASPPTPDPSPLPSDRLETLMRTVRREFPNRVEAGASKASAKGHTWIWFQPPSLLWAASLVLLLGGLWLFFERSPSSNSRPDSALGTTAYLLLKTGQVEIVRHSHPFPGRSGMALSPTDILRVAPGTALALITPDGPRSLASPGSFRVADLLPPSTLAAPASDAVASWPLPVVRTLFVAKAEALTAIPLSIPRGAGTISVYSPRQATASRTPAILWKGDPGKTYDLLLIDELEPSHPPLRLPQAVSPVDFIKVPEWKGKSLAPGGLYRLIIQESDRPLSAVEHTFTVLPAGDPLDPTHLPEEKLAQAYLCFTREPVRTGDALSLLLGLPPDYGRTELALRLKLLAFGSLGLADEFHETAAQLKATVSKP